MQVGYLLCDGCDECRTDTISADDEAHDWPCCEFFPDDKAPCCYVVIARCRSEVIHDLSFSDGCASGPTTALLMYPVFELRKKCYVGCEWVMDDCTEVEDQTTDALNPSFPPASLTAGAISYHQGDYRSGYTGCIASGPGPDRWTLAVAGTAAGDVTLTLTHTAIVAWATGDGRTIPVYENVEAWNAFGRNRMDIVAGYDDFPMLPKSICVVAVDEPGADDNPCDTHEDRCACNDFTIGDSVTFNIVVTGCDGYTFPSTIDLTRYKDPDALPCGVTYPASDPCGVFIGELSTGDGCTNEAGTWSGGVLLMFWCDGTTYNIKAYCYDTELECWVEQGNATITELELTCDGTVYVEFTLPDMDCCCPEEPPIDVCCCNVPVSTILTWDDGTNSGTLTWNGTRWVGTGNPDACTGVELRLTCLGDPVCAWDLNIDGFVNQPANVTSITCEPFSLTFNTGDGCDGNPVTIIITD
jgi:hypothetical protein